MQVFSLFQNEISIRKVEVELHTRFQIPSFHILGLPAPEIQEARERIQAAFISAGLDFPKKKVMVNLTPSSERKSGTGHDLAIALKIITEIVEIRWPKEYSQEIYAWGELGLDAKIKPCGHLAKWVELIQQQKIHVLCLCSEDLKRLVELFHWRRKQGLPIPADLKLLEINSLSEMQTHFNSIQTLVPLRELLNESTLPEQELNYPLLLPLSITLERVLKITLAGRHHLLILGPKGMGKSQSLEWIRILSPAPDALKTWERILNLDIPLSDSSFVLPIRRVHAQIRPTHLLGSWSSKGFQAGELSKAHGGILIADEFLEWPRDAKECLREPLEQKQYALTRKQGTVQLNCDLQFIGTGNLCPCGGVPPQYQNASFKKSAACRCRPGDVERYLFKLSGPVADRIDLVMVHVEMPKKSNLVCSPEQIHELKLEIAEAQSFCFKRFGNLPSQLSPSWLEEHLPKGPSTEKILSAAPSLRSRHKILRIARTIQAIEKSEELKPEHLLEASSFRYEGLVH